MSQWFAGIICTLTLTEDARTYISIEKKYVFINYLFKPNVNMDQKHFYIKLIVLLIGLNNIYTFSCLIQLTIWACDMSVPAALQYLILTSLITQNFNGTNGNI
jgi:hypothetical protein